MKRKVIAGLLVAVLTMTSAPFLGGTAGVVHAEPLVNGAGEVLIELCGDKIKMVDEGLSDENGNKELSIGEKAFVAASAIDENGNYLEFSKDWEFLDDETIAEYFEPQFYSEKDDLKQASVDENRVLFDGVIPKEAFGKYVYKWDGIENTKEGDDYDLHCKLVRSSYRVTSTCGTDYITFNMNDDKKSVTAFTILNQNFAFTASIPKTVKENGKSYTVTDIGSYALENTDGKGMKALVLPNSIKTIGENAFEGAKNLKTITIKSNLSSVGKNAFKGINKKAVFKIKASAKNYKNIVFKIKQSGVAKTVKFKRIK